MNVSIDHVLEIVGEYVARTKGHATGTLAADTPLMSGGFVDSFGLAELISELERRFEMTLADGSLIPEDFESVRTLTQRLEEISS